jgi:cytochrome c oxidase subunit 4
MMQPSEKTADERVHNSSAGPSHAMRWAVIFLILCGLTGTSFIAANSSLMENRFVGSLIIGGISLLKAMLVVLFFMHLWWEASWKYLVTVPALVMAVILALSLIPDIGYRTGLYSQERQKFAPTATSDTHSNDPVLKNSFHD